MRLMLCSLASTGNDVIVTSDSQLSFTPSDRVAGSDKLQRHSSRQVTWPPTGFVVTGVTLILLLPGGAIVTLRSTSGVVSCPTEAEIATVVRQTVTVHNRRVCFIRTSFRSIVSLSVSDRPPANGCQRCEQHSTDDDAVT